MAPELAERVLDPFVTSRTTRKVGLGLPLLKAAAEACDGGLALTTAPGQGTRVSVDLQYSHLDRMPLGDLAGTWLTLLVAHPEVSWRFVYRAGDGVFDFQDEPLKRELGPVPLTDPDVLRLLREWLEGGVAETRTAALQTVGA
jgi:hypothetical protein